MTYLLELIKQMEAVGISETDDLSIEITDGLPAVIIKHNEPLEVFIQDEALSRLLPMTTSKTTKQ